MALIQADNFNIYGTVKAAPLVLSGVYAEAGGDNGTTEVYLPVDPDGVSPGHVLRVDGGGQGATGNYQRLRFVLPHTTLTCGIAERMWIAGIPSTTGQRPTPFMWKDVSNNILFAVQVTPTGRLQIVNSAGTVLGTTTNPVVSAQGWYHLEAKLFVDASVGSIEIRVEGTAVLVLTNFNTGTVPVGQIAVANRPDVSSASVSMYIKDFVVWDSSGSFNNDFLGSVLVTNLSPTSDVDLNWTPSTGSTGYTILDNVPPVDTQFISAPYSAISPNYPDPYVAGHGPLPIDVTTVKGIVTYVRAAKADGGDGSLQVGIISDPSGSPAVTLGANRPITVAQTYWKDVFEVDPATSSPWLPNAVNVSQLQINRTA